MFWTNVIIVLEFDILYMIYKFESFWPNFHMMTSQHVARISRFQEHSFINKYLTSSFLLFFIFILLWPLVHEMQVQVLYQTNFGLMTSQNLVETSKCWDRGFKNKYLTSNSPLLLNFIFLSPLVHEIQIWILLIQLWFNNVTSKSKLQYLEKMISETNCLLKSSIKL